MASDSIEIEIRVPVSESDFTALRNRLLQTPGLSKSVSQSDDYFSAPNRDFLAPAFPFEWLSVRKRGNRVVLNYKHFFPENVPTTTHCEEVETDVGSREALLRMLASLGFQKLVTVEKERETFDANGEFEIALDRVSELGFFVEVEALKDFGGVELTRKKVHAFASSLGLDVHSADQRGYPFLLMKKKGLLK